MAETTQAETTQAEMTQGRIDSRPKRLTAETTRYREIQGALTVKVYWPREIR